MRVGWLTAADQATPRDFSDRMHASLAHENRTHPRLKAAGVEFIDENAARGVRLLKRERTKKIASPSSPCAFSVLCLFSHTNRCNVEVWRYMLESRL